MKLLFKSTPTMKSYIGFKDGEYREVDEKQAHHLLTNFPDNFLPEVEEKKVEPKQDKSVKNAENKSAGKAK